MKTQGEIEAAICEGIRRFEREYMGRGPKDIHTHLIGDLLLVRLQGVLTAAEQHLVKTLPALAPVADIRGEGPRAAAWRGHAAALRETLEREGWDGRSYRRGGPSRPAPGRSR